MALILHGDGLGRRIFRHPPLLGVTAWALSIDEDASGSDHPKVALRLSNLLQATGWPEEAESLLRRALAIDEAGSGSSHPSVARDLNNLARLLQDARRLDEAEPLLRRALEIVQASERETGSATPLRRTIEAHYSSLLREPRRPRWLRWLRSLGG